MFQIATKIPGNEMGIQPQQVPNWGHSNNTFTSILNFFFDPQICFQHYCHLFPECDAVPTLKNKVKLYHNLLNLVDTEIIDGAYVVDSSVIRQDKIGKLGDYFLCVLLEQFFKIDCYVDKAKFISNTNSSVHGCDVLYYSKKINELFFGEAKITDELSYGIQEANDSLKVYEKRIVDETHLILNSWSDSDLLAPFGEDFLEAASCSFTFSEFVKKKSMKGLTIPVFIGHGKEYDPKQILEALGNVTSNVFCGLNTHYLILSLPILSKHDFVLEAKKAIAQLIADLKGKEGDVNE
jgi:hypothetical protein